MVTIIIGPEELYNVLMYLYRTEQFLSWRGGGLKYAKQAGTVLHINFC